MKKLIISGLGAICTLFAGALSAQNCYECFDPCNALISIKADYLYWTAKQNDREFARIATGTNDVDFAAFGTDTVKQDRYDWDSGYRVGAGYRPCDCLWSLDLVYTHFKTHGKKAVSVPAVQGMSANNNVTVVIPSLPAYDPSSDFLTSGNIPFGIVTEARSHSDVRLDLGDLNLLRHSFCNAGCINVNFLLGIRGGRISSHWHTFYFYPNASVTNFGSSTRTVGDAIQHTDTNWSYLSIGPRFGAEGDVALGCGFSLYGNFSGSILWGKFKRKNETRFQIPVDSSDSDGSTGYTNDLKKSHYKLTPVLQGEAGFAYTYTCDQWVIRGRVGIEMLTFINLAENTFYTFPRGHRFKDSITDLDLYGLTAGLEVAF